MHLDGLNAAKGVTELMMKSRDGIVRGPDGKQLLDAETGQPIIMEPSRANAINDRISSTNKSLSHLGEIEKHIQDTDWLGRNGNIAYNAAVQGLLAGMPKERAEQIASAIPGPREFSENQGAALAALKRAIQLEQQYEVQQAGGTRAESNLGLTK
jgi:hypothetical protein